MNPLALALQLLAGAKIIDVDQNLKEDRQLFNAAQVRWPLVERNLAEVAPRL